MKTKNKPILSRVSSKAILRKLKKHKCEKCKINKSKHVYQTLFLCHDCYKEKKAEEKNEINKIERKSK